MKTVEFNPNGPIKITLSGPMGSGKSTIANVIKKALEDAGIQQVEFVAYDYRYRKTPEFPETKAIVEGKRLADRPARKVFITETVEE